MILRASPSSQRRAINDKDVILVVEDDLAVRNSLQFSLEAEGYAVRVFPDVRSLLAADFPERGCIVADYFLPDGNGLDLIRSLRGQGIGLPAILVTSSPSPALRRSAASVGVLIVEKPLLGNALSEEIGAAIARAF